MQGSGDLRYYLETLRRFKPYTLSEAEEKIINSKDVNGIDAMVGPVRDDHQRLHSSSWRSTARRRTLTRDELAAYFQNPIRGAARAGLPGAVPGLQRELDGPGADVHPPGARLAHRGHRAARLQVAHRRPATWTTTCPTRWWRRCWRCAARMPASSSSTSSSRPSGWGWSKLTRYDIYAPLTPSDKKYSWAECHAAWCWRVTSAFSPEVAALAKRVFDENHLDAEIRSGKRGGAFCYTAMPSLTPWVLVNYQDQRARHCHAGARAGARHPCHAGRAGIRC